VFTEKRYTAGGVIVHSYRKALILIAAILFSFVLVSVVAPKNSIGLPHPQSPIPTSAIYLPLTIREGADQPTAIPTDTPALTHTPTFTNALYIPIAIREEADQSTTTSIDMPALTPTPALSDLAMTGIVEKGEFAGVITNTVYAGYPVHFFVTIENQGLGPVNSPFWIDLFVDLPGAMPADALYPIFYQSVDWMGVGFLSPGSPVVIRLTYSQGFPVATDYYVCALADTLKTVDELNDSNNVNCTSFSVVDPPIAATTSQH
jgi:hypothetical protein